MEYLPGKNAGTAKLDGMAQAAKDTIAKEIIDNLLSYHKTENPRGFGELDGAEFLWRLADILCSHSPEYRQESA
jgi:hypothetical protein